MELGWAILPERQQRGVGCQAHAQASCPGVLDLVSLQAAGGQTHDSGKRSARHLWGIHFACRVCRTGINDRETNQLVY